MSNNDPKRESELDDFRRAVTQQGFTQPASAPGKSPLERFIAGAGDVADRSTGWLSAQVKEGLGDFVNRFIYGQTTSSPEPGNRDQEQTREPEKGRDR